MFEIPFWSLSPVISNVKIFVFFNTKFQKKQNSIIIGITSSSQVAPIVECQLRWLMGCGVITPISIFSLPISVCAFSATNPTDSVRCVPTVSVVRKHDDTTDTLPNRLRIRPSFRTESDTIHSKHRGRRWAPNDAVHDVQSESTRENDVFANPYCPWWYRANRCPNPNYLCKVRKVELIDKNYIDNDSTVIHTSTYRHRARCPDDDVLHSVRLHRRRNSTWEWFAAKFSTQSIHLMSRKWTSQAEPTVESSRWR